MTMGENGSSISVLMPVYNAEKYIEAAVDSILKQTFTDFEFIIINDGSTDGTLDILQRYARQDSRIRLISRENKGLVATLNEGLALAKAPLIARMDADDIALENRLYMQKSYMDDHGEVVCIGSRARIIDDRGRFLILTNTKIGHKEVEKSALQGCTPIMHPTAMMLTKAVNQVGGYQQSNYPAEDLALWIQLSELGRIDNIADVLLEYRIHDNSITTTAHNLQLQKLREISEKACKKRGLNLEFLAKASRPNGSRISRFDLKLKHGWWAFSNKQWKTSAIYAAKVIFLMPFCDGGWRLLFCSFFRRGR